VGSDRGALIPNRGPLLLVEHLTKRYADIQAVRDLSFEVRPAEVVGLLGRNGAGKTTTISCICGLQGSDGGRVEILGRDALTDPSGAHRDFAVATQDIALYPGLSVARNLAFFASLGGIPRPELDAAVADVTKLLDLEELLRRHVVTLSGGQQRLVHVAAALVQRPTLVLLDEPTAGLDVGARATVLRAIGGIARAGAGALFSSHYLPEAEDVCDRVLIVERGTLVAAGTVGECVARYGRASVEIRVAGDVVSHDGSDVSAAIAALTPRQRERIQSVRVIGDSLESVFARVTGLEPAVGDDGGVVP